MSALSALVLLTVLASALGSGVVVLPTPQDSCIDVVYLMTCPEGFAYEFYGSCYGVFLEGKTQFEAEVACSSYGATLAEVQTEGEHHFLMGIAHSMSTSLLWLRIGGIDLNHQDNWVWESTRTPITLDGWQPGQPNPGGQEYCMAYKAGVLEGWHDLSCTTNVGYICELDYL